ncbi:hypothetical protein [Chitinophaga rhizosphaerae]|uniref:hypothetical protein n=1 Tax=Chitinophaga rhizosphaerae TaxID=1864947 RepID=UPI000F8068F8|nr:hypothetical protein [Chitinophaga rhizosphaerae]
MDLPEEPNSMSMLENLHKHFDNAGKAFKDRVCLDCDFSNATYYRKVSTSKYATITRAERDRILEIAEYIVGKLNDCISLYK